MVSGWVPSLRVLTRWPPPCPPWPVGHQLLPHPHRGSIFHQAHSKLLQHWVVIMPLQGLSQQLSPSYVPCVSCCSTLVFPWMTSHLSRKQTGLERGVTQVNLTFLMSPTSFPSILHAVSQRPPGRQSQTLGAATTASHWFPLIVPWPLLSHCLATDDTHEHLKDSSLWETAIIVTLMPYYYPLSARDAGSTTTYTMTLTWNSPGGEQ